jgi:hypothetical protein
VPPINPSWFAPSATITDRLIQVTIGFRIIKGGSRSLYLGKETFAIRTIKDPVSL